MAISIPYCYLVRPKVVTFFIKIILSGIISKVCLATTSNKLERPLNRDDEISSVPLSVKPRLPHGMPHWWSFLSLFSRELEGGLAIRAAFHKTNRKKKKKCIQKHYWRIVSSGIGVAVVFWSQSHAHDSYPWPRASASTTPVSSKQYTLMAYHCARIDIWMNEFRFPNVEYRQQT